MYLTRLRRVLGGLLALTLLLAAPAASRAVAPLAIPDGEQKALADYRLTLDKLARTSAVIKKLAAAARTDAQIGREVDALNNVGQLDSFEAVNAIYEQRAPHLTAVLRGEGYDAREFVLSMGSTMLAYNGARQRAAGQEDQILPFVPAANVDLAEKNPAKFEDAVREIISLNSLSAEAP